MSPVYGAKDAPDLGPWNDFVASQPSGSLLQTTQWGMLKGDFDWDWELVTIEDATAPRAGALVLYQQLPLKAGSIAYVPRGPVVDWEDAETVTTLSAKIEEAARRRHAWACWVEPKALDGSDAEQHLINAGFASSSRTIQPRSTILVDISPPEEDILMAMKSKTRYNIRLSGRKDVTTREGDMEDVSIFYDLIEETGERDEFGVHSRGYYRRAFELFKPRGEIGLILAEYEGEPLAGLMVFAVGDTAYYITGASSNRHRNRMPAYAIQWAAIKWAKARGCTLYDLWGIPDADEETLEAEFTERSDGLWGVYRFKRGFGGDVVRYTGLWEKSLHPLYPAASHLYRYLH
ncbi:MAG: lipid II:glycine glycyltransferase FemX [Anaerolineae bacterium]